MSRPLLYILIVTPNDISTMVHFVPFMFVTLSIILLTCALACADQCNFARIQARLPENSSDNVFLVLNVFYSFTEGVQWLFKRKLQFSKVSEGFQHFPGGGGGGGWSQLFLGGSKCSIDNHTPWLSYVQ